MFLEELFIKNAYNVNLYESMLIQDNERNSAVFNSVMIQLELYTCIIGLQIYTILRQIFTSQVHSE